MKKIMIFTLCCLTLSAVCAGQVDSTPKSKFPARKKIAIGIALTMINLIFASESFQKFKYSIACILCSKNRVCSVGSEIYLNPFSAHYVMLSDNQYPGITEFTVWSACTIFHVVCATQGFEFIGEGMTELYEIRQNENKQ